MVIGFPLLTTLALQTSTTSHAAVVVGLLPLTTAVFAAATHRPPPLAPFWAAALAGAAVVIAFTVQQSGGALTTGDLYLFGALLICAAGYTEGGRLARGHAGLAGDRLGAGAVPAAGRCRLGDRAVRRARHLGGARRGRAAVGRGGLAVLRSVRLVPRAWPPSAIAKASQLQLAQPLLTLVWSVLLLGEHLSPAAPIAAVAVLVCIAVTQRGRGRTGRRTTRTSGAIRVERP